MEQNGELHKRKDMHGLRRIFRTALGTTGALGRRTAIEKTRTRICKRDTSHTESENCHGGTATCTQRATCTVCGAEYGDALGHDFLPVGHMMITSTGSSVPVGIKRMT